MTPNQSAVELWQAFKQMNPLVADEYSVWAFGNTPEMATELVQYVVTGEKTRTSSLYQLYEIDKEPLPKVGEYSVILDGEGVA